jgi:hypothetical protein
MLLFCSTCLRCLWIQLLAVVKHSVMIILVTREAISELAHQGVLLARWVAHQGVLLARSMERLCRLYGDDVIEALVFGTMFVVEKTLALFVIVLLFIVAGILTITGGIAGWVIGHSIPWAVGGAAAVLLICVVVDDLCRLTFPDDSSSKDIA